MTIPSRPAPPPPQTTSQQQQHGGGQQITIKLPPPPTAASANVFHSRYSKTSSLSTNYYESTSAISSPSSSSITRHFPAARTRYEPATNWSDTPFDMQENSSIYNDNDNYNVSTNNMKKNPPPPRPPPPRLSPNNFTNTVLKKPGPPQSVNMLSNLFGKKKNVTNNKKPLPKIPPQPFSNQNSNMSRLHHYALQPTRTTPPPMNFALPPPPTTTTTATTNINNTGTDLLISFDSPPSSPTFTQKSNSDCVSVDSFSSDSNFSSPNNGSVSQPESGFEDDFTSPTDPWETMPIEHQTFGNDNTRSIFNDSQSTHPVRNLYAINNLNPNDNPLCNGKSILPPPPILAKPTIIRPKIVQNLKRGLAPKPPTPTVFEIAEHVPVSSYGVDDDSPPSPPMPHCPPPPPPATIGNSVLDVITGKIDAVSLTTFDDDDEEPSYGIALYDFEGVEDGDLSLRQNEKVYLMEKLNEEWLLGRNKRGCEGMFPSNFIDIKIPLKKDTINKVPVSKPTVSNQLINKEQSNSQKVHKVKAIFNFTAEAPEDLSIKENDLVTILYRINDDWLYGELHNHRGQFPANFIEYIPENLPLK